MKRTSETLHRGGVRIVVLGLALTALGGCAGGPRDAPAGEPDSAAPLADPGFSAARALETFDAAWRIVHETHYDTTFGGTDWAAEIGRAS